MLPEPLRFPSRISSDQRGNVAMMFGLLLFPVVMVTGIAIDYGQASQIASSMQSATDSAALGGLRAWQTEPDQAKTRAVAEALYMAQSGSGGEGSTLSIALDEVKGRLKVTAVTRVPTKFMKVFGRSHIEVDRKSTAILRMGGQADSSLEIAMMLDTTGSMSGTKMVDLKRAATEFVDMLVWDEQTGRTSRLALVPFSAAVDVGNAYFEAATGLSANSRPNTCVVERTGSEAFTDAEPGDGARFAPYPGSFCSASGTIIPMTADKARLKSSIASLETRGRTAGHIGTAWAWYMLAPDWGQIWPQDSRPMPYGAAKVRKIAVLMTDGEYNTTYNAAGSASEQAVALCTAMKAKGIEVFTIGFELGGNATAINTLKACASSETNFYDANDGDALLLAFRDIAMSIVKLRLAE